MSVCVRVSGGNMICYLHVHSDLILSHEVGWRVTIGNEILKK